MRKYKIIFNFYSTLNNINYILTKYIYFIITLLLIINVNLHFQTQKKDLYAFNISIAYLIESRSQVKKVKRIEIDGVNSILIKKTLYQDKCLHRLLNLQKVNFLTVINKVKKSGFIKSTKGYFFRSGNHKYLVLDIKVNSLIKLIKITRWSQLKIPQSLLIDILKVHLGKPYNYIEMHRSIKAIYDWYQMQGFRWVSVKVLKSRQDAHLNFKIFEGKIFASSLVYGGKQILNSEQIGKIERQIIQQLSLLPGTILNIKRLEYGIAYLKKIRLISHCTYKIINHLNDFNIQLTYDIFPEREISLSMKNIMSHRCDGKWIDIDYSKRTESKKSRKIVYRTFYSNTAIRSLLVFIQRILETNLKKTFLQKYIGLKYILFNQRHQKKPRNILIKIKTVYKSAYLSATYLHPNIKIHKKLLSDFKIVYYKNSYITYDTFLLRVGSFVDSAFNRSILSSIKAQGITLYFKQNLAYSTSLKETLMNKYYKSYKKFIHRKSFYKNRTVKNLEKQNSYQSNVISKLAKQAITILQLKLKYNTLSVNEQTKSGVLLFIKSLLYISDLRISDKFHVKQSLSIKYNQILCLPNILARVYGSIVRFSFEGNYSVGSKNFLPVFSEQDSDLNTSDIIFTKLDQYSIYLNLYKCKTEHHVFMNRYNSIYLFCSLSGYLQNNAPLIHIPRLYKLFNTQKNKIGKSIGLGIQLNTPMKKIPHLRIEYQINATRKKFFRMCMYANYN